VVRSVLVGGVMPPVLELLPAQGLILRHWPSVLALLEERGVPPAPRPGDTRDLYENRIGTGLMALFRDTRDPGVFEALYAFSRASVLVWIRGLLGRQPGSLDAQELLQDTFVNVYRYPKAFRDEHGGSFRVWVRTIAGNAVRRAVKRRARRRVEEGGEVPSELQDGGAGPAQVIEDDEARRRLRGAWMLFLMHYGRAWSNLSQRDRRTLHLVEVEGLSYEEAGRVLAVGRSNLKMIVFRSRRRIARHMRAAMASAHAGAVAGASSPRLAGVA
jgi:RNA polymerase sigma-70 factor (ECF subfamily)